MLNEHISPNFIVMQNKKTTSASVFEKSTNMTLPYLLFIKEKHFALNAWYQDKEDE